ncbi:MAG: GspE/PulE family protein [Hyphomicrobium sp.]
MQLNDAPPFGGLPDPRSEAFVAKLSAALTGRGLIDELGLMRAQRARQQSNERFDVVLARLGLVNDSDLADVLSGLLGLDLVKADEWPERALPGIDIKPAFLKASRMVPIAADDSRIVVAVADPFNQGAIASLSFLLDRRVDSRLAASAGIEQCIERIYGHKAVAEAGPQVARIEGNESAVDDVRRLEDMASEAPVIRLVQSLVERAVAAQASDIHIEPRDDSVRVRFRIDGVLHTVETLPLTVRAALSSRIKIMAQLNIAERRLPQDGRIRINVRGRDIDLRVSTVPAMCGESVVLRILDRSSVALDFMALGFDGEALSAFQALLQQPNGIILVTGPTGSGKTTTLYTALSALNSSERKLFTVEDPIEYRLDGVNQIQVNPKIGLSFAAALRSILRQDPDIVMVGEIRDLETAEIAIRASLTGHLVLSTVHTNSAAATVTRLLDMGVEDYLMASSLKAVVAQRLVRRLCHACSEPAEVSPAQLEKIYSIAGITGAPAKSGAHSIRKACGCKQCRNTGFSGRTTIYEVLTVSEPVRDAVLTEGTERRIEDAARASGMVPMISNGIAKVLAGETTLEEVLRVTRFDDAALHL